MVAQGREDWLVGEIMFNQGRQVSQDLSLGSSGLVPDVVGRQVSRPQDVVKLQRQQSNILHLCVRVACCKLADLLFKRQALPNCKSDKATFYSCVCVTCCKLADLPFTRQALPNCNTGRATFCSVLHVASWQIFHSKDWLYQIATAAEQHSTVVCVCAARCKLADLPFARQALPNCNRSRAKIVQLIIINN